MEIKAGYKLTDVGAIPDDWTISTITQASEMTTVGFVGPMSHLFTPSGIPVFRGQDVLPNRLDPSDTKFISLNTHKAWKKSALKGGDVVMVRVGVGAGTSCVIPHDIGQANAASLVVIRPSAKRLDATFLSMVINSEFGKKQVESLLVGGAQPVINTATVAAFKFPLPTIAEQKAIAEALNDADALIEALEGLVGKKRQVKQGAMQELLKGKRRLPGFNDRWKLKKIGEITQSTAGGTPSTAVASYWDGNIRWMSSGELHLKRVYDVEGRITEEGLRNSSTKIIPPKCVLVGLAGQGKTRGTVAMNMVELCTNQSIAAIFPSSSFVPNYLYFNLDNRYEELREVSSGDGGRGGLNLTLINKLEIPLPSIPEQTAIAEILSDMDAEIAALEGKLSKARQVKQGMMQELLTGRVRLV